MHFYLKEPKSKNKSLIIVKYYVGKDKKYFQLSTNIKINPLNWDKIKKLPKHKRGIDGLKLLTIESKLIDINKKIQNLRIDFGKNLTIGDLKLAFNKKEEMIYMLDYFKSFIDERIKVGEVSDRSVIKYKTVLKKLVLFQIHKKTKYKLSDLKEDFFTSLIIYFRNNHNLYDNTVARYISVIKTFLRWCLKKGYSPPMYFQDVKVKKHETDDIALTMAEVELFTKADLTPAQDRCRDLFLIGVYSGQRWSDYSVFDKTDVRDNVIVKRAKKTSTNSYIPLHKKLKAILDKYDWELPNISQAKFNKHLKAIGKKLEINDKIKFTHSKGNLKEVEIKEKWELITSHTARRTYITLAAENNIPDHTIMDITGIRDSGTLKKYKKSNKESNVELTKKLFNF
jgi:integrase